MNRGEERGGVGRGGVHTVCIKNRCLDTASHITTPACLHRDS